MYFFPLFPHSLRSHIIFFYFFTKNFLRLFFAIFPFYQLWGVLAFIRYLRVNRRSTLRASVQQKCYHSFLSCQRALLSQQNTFSRAVVQIQHRHSTWSGFSICFMYVRKHKFYHLLLFLYLLLYSQRFSYM